MLFTCYVYHFDMQNKKNCLYNEIKIKILLWCKTMFINRQLILLRKRLRHYTRKLYSSLKNMSILIYLKFKQLIYILKKSKIKLFEVYIRMINLFMYVLFFSLRWYWYWYRFFCNVFTNLIIPLEESFIEFSELYLSVFYYTFKRNRKPMLFFYYTYFLQQNI